MRLNRWRGKRKRLVPEINLTSLIDTTLTLLIIFMVASPMIKRENALQVELPKGSIQEVEDSRSQEIVVVISKQEKLFVGDILCDSSARVIEQLEKKIGDSKSGVSSDKTVFVKADTAVSYGKVMDLVDKIKHVGGVRYVALATTKIA